MGTIDGPIALAQPALSFDDLARLRLQSREIGKAAVKSLAGYRDAVTGGYFHLLVPDDKRGHAPGEPSKASSATVIEFLINSGRWVESLKGDDSATAARKLIRRYVKDEKWDSAGIGPDNPFTVAFILELVSALLTVQGTLTPAGQKICREKLVVLEKALTDGGGRVSIEEVPNSYLTELVCRVLVDWSTRGIVPGAPKISPDLERQVWQEAIASINAELALAEADPQNGDPFELGYALLLVLRFPGQRTRPEHRVLLRTALAAFFAAQRPNGSWPRSRRLFRYPDYGDAYCYEFEFLSRLLRELSRSGPDSNRKALLPYLANLQLSITRLTREAVALPHGGYGWSSGHHRAFVYPESWSTAGCFDVCDLIDRLATDTATTVILQHLDEERLAGDPDPDDKPLKEILDSAITLPSKRTESLKAVLEQNMLAPVLAQATAVREGKELTKKGVAISAILYGPPGTSKTSYAKAISAYLGWDLITIDPSHLLRQGIDNIHFEIGRIFQMLDVAERVVIFFDEIDELVRDRGDQEGGPLSRFLTTSMLPRIIKLRSPRKRVFLVATNHIENFDGAIARPGRFDLVVPVMPPTADAKLRQWDGVATAMARHGLSGDTSVRKSLEILTYDEMEAIAEQLAASTSPTAFKRQLGEAAKKGTLSQPVNKKGPTWLKLMEGEASKIRLGA